MEAALRQTVRPWTEVFRRSTLGPWIYTVKGTADLHRGLGYFAGGHDDWDWIVERCEELEVPAKATCSYFPGTATCEALDFAFLDGGVFSRGGDYFIGIHGAWVYGVHSLRFLCYELGLTQPKLQRGQSELLTHDALLREIVTQQRWSKQLLEERIEHNRSVHEC